MAAEALRGRPEMVRTILTERNAHPLLMEPADTATEMREVKPADEKGIPAQLGIEPSSGLRIPVPQMAH